MPPQKKIKVGILEQSKLFLHALEMLITEQNRFNIVLTSTTPQELRKKMVTTTAVTQPDVIIISIRQQPGEYASSIAWLREKFPGIKLLAIIVQHEKEEEITGQLPVHGYLNKKSSPRTLFRYMVAAPIQEPQKTRKHIAYTIRHKKRIAAEQAFLKGWSAITDHTTKQFILLSCNDYTNKEIAKLIRVSEKRLYVYQHSVFRQLNVSSRIDLLKKTVKFGMVTL